ncbi:MAG: hydantoinase/oxoprolinase family protein [Acidimicrobiales bacterium]
MSPEFREYERTVTTVVNAYLLPTCRACLEGLDGAADEVRIMTSAGGLTDLDDAARFPVSLLLSGPAGGVLAGSSVAAASGFPDAVTFDMGGTSTDVCLVQGGVPEPAGERSVAGFPIRRPSLDVHTIGAGGGSIAKLDAGGALAVGPRSAGAVPGPACYGHGGTEATVTDADLVAGRLPTGVSLPGIGVLDRSAAQRALDEAGITADDVIAVVDAAMEEAVRAVSVARGVDRAASPSWPSAAPDRSTPAPWPTRGHGCRDRAARAGVLSAVGCLAAPVQADRVRSWPRGADLTGLEEEVEALMGELDAAAGSGDGGAPMAGVERFASFDCRYQGQSHEIRVGEPGDFPAAHEQRNGYARPGTPIEVVAVRATRRVASPVQVGDLPPVERTSVVGPAVIAEADCTIWVPDGWRADPHPVTSAFVLTRAAV